ncbi:MAG: hypothetical protein IJW32_00105 [Clostridia bacterium]|nr:hypothetical protein [Clostridia bacterium]
MMYNKETINTNKIEKERKGGKHLLGMLQNLYCSCQSEFSAFLLFNYQSLTIKNKKIAKVLEDFSKQHLENSKKLSALILQEKGLPFYLNSQHSPLTAFWLQFDTEENKVLQIDINFLTTLINNYSIYISKIKKQSVLKVLKELQQSNVNFLEKLSSLKNIN